MLSYIEQGYAVLCYVLFCSVLPMMSFFALLCYVVLLCGVMLCRAFGMLYLHRKLQVTLYISLSKQLLFVPAAAKESQLEKLSRERACWLSSIFLRLHTFVKFQATDVTRAGRGS